MTPLLIKVSISLFWYTLSLSVLLKFTHYNIINYLVEPQVEIFELFFLYLLWRIY